MTYNEKKQIYYAVMNVLAKLVNKLICEKFEFNDTKSEKKWDLSRNIIKDIPEMKKRLKRVAFDKYIEPTYGNVLKFLKEKYDVGYMWFYSEDADYGEPSWIFQTYPLDKLQDKGRFGCFPESRYDSVDDGELDAIVSIIDEIIDKYGKEPENSNKFGNFDLDRDLSIDFPEYRERLIEIDFPEFLEMTYENVLEFFKNIYDFSFCWNYASTPSSPDDDYTWVWSCRIPSEEKNKGVSGAFPEFGYIHKCEDEEQEAIMSIIDYMTNRVENLDF